VQKDERKKVCVLYVCESVSQCEEKDESVCEILLTYYCFYLRKGRNRRIMTHFHVFFVCPIIFYPFRRAENAERLWGKMKSESKINFPWGKIR